MLYRQQVSGRSFTPTYSPFGLNVSCSVRLKDQKPKLVNMGTETRKRTQAYFGAGLAPRKRSCLRKGRADAIFPFRPGFENWVLVIDPPAMSIFRPWKRSPRLHGDLGRVGGLLKMWLSDRNAEQARQLDVPDLLIQLHALQADMKAKVKALVIAKRAHRRKDSKSSFSTLVEYITRDGKAAQKDGIEYSRITHCGFDTLDVAILEIEATQARNTRSKIDKTYHLIVSFQEDEIVGQEKLFDIEDEICRAIGLGDHQRISTTHQDTDNQHLHIAINKIHPISHLAIEPYYDYMKLDKACAALEYKHELQTDNRIADTQDRVLDETLQSGKAGDMEAHKRNGFIPALDWGARKSISAKHLSTAKSWADVHQGLGRNGLTIRPRGAGLVISAKKAKATMKASELGRKFSKGVLESRFGAYQPPSKETEIEDFSVIQSYRKVPRSQGGKLSSPLWDTYRDEKHRIVAEKKLAKDEVWQQRPEEIGQGTK